MTSDDLGVPSSGEQPREGVPPQQPPYGQRQPPNFPMPPPGYGRSQQPPYFPPPRQEPQGYFPGSAQQQGPPQQQPTEQYQLQQPDGQPQRPPRKPASRTMKIVFAVLASIAGIMVIAVIATAASRNSNKPTASSSHGSVLCPGGYYAASLAACNSTDNTEAPPPTPPPAGPESLGVGQSLSITDGGTDAGTITITSIRNTTQPADSFGEAPQNGYYLIVTVKVSSTEDGLDMNDLDFYALVNGQHYDYGNGNSFEAVSDNNQDLTTTLNNGESETGYLLFDLPSIHGQIVYAPNFNSAPLAEWSY